MSEFGDIMDSFFGGRPKPSADSLADLNKKLAEQKKQKPRDTAPIPQLRSKTIDGVKYLRAEDVVEALRVTDSAVRVRVHITKWLAK